MGHGQNDCLSKMTGQHPKLKSPRGLISINFTNEMSLKTQILKKISIESRDGKQNDSNCEY